MENKEVYLDGEKFEIHVGRYPFGGGFYIGLWSMNEGPYGNLSINLFDHPNTNLGSKIGGLAENEFVVNHDWLGVPSLQKMLTELLLSGLFEDTGKKVSYGFCKDIPIWKYKA